ncbi:MAG: MgtC/SapB family protein [Gemmatimonadota bacterium]
MDWQAQLGLLGLVGLAMLLGGLVGLERERARKPAGLRTLMLVSGAAALLVKLGDSVLAHYVRGVLASPGSAAPGELIQSDPIRIIEAIITGTSILGAGTIIRRPMEDNVEGLTTAAAILFVAAVGIAVALEQFWVAVGATILALAALTVLGAVERSLLGRD